MAASTFGSWMGACVYLSAETNVDDGDNNSIAHFMFKYERTKEKECKEKCFRAREVYLPLSVQRDVMFMFSLFFFIHCVRLLLTNSWEKKYFSFIDIDAGISFSSFVAAFSLIGELMAFFETCGFQCKQI